MSSCHTDVKHLPRIQSQRKVNTPFERTSTRQALNSRVPIHLQKPVSNNNMKRTQSSANMSKNVKYESTGAAYKKKVEDLQRQNEIIQGEIKNIQLEIDMFRKNKKKGNDNGKKQTEGTTLRKNLNMSDSSLVKKEIKLLENKVAVMRRKIDEQHQKNSSVKKQIEDVRRQIQTLKNINKKTCQSLQKTKEQFNYMSELSEQLDEQIGIKNNTMHKAKVEGVHKKAQLIKQYDNILKELEKQLGENNENDRNSEVEGQGFYMTQIIAQNKGISPSKRRVKMDINQLKNKINRYEKQFEGVKECMNSKSSDQIISKFEDGHQNNYHHYQFINELFQTLRQVQLEHEQLQNKKQMLLRQLQNGVSSTKIEETVSLQLQIQAIRTQKKKVKGQSRDYENMYGQLREVVRNYIQKLGIDFQLEEEITQRNMIGFLHLIKQKATQLNLFESQQIDPQEYNNCNLDQLLEQAKKEQGKNDKILTQSQFMESHQAFLRKKQQKELKRKKK